MKKPILAACAVTVVTVATALAGAYTAIRVDAPIAEAYKPIETAAISVGKVIAVEAFSVVTNKTITFVRVDNAGATTNIVAASTPAWALYACSKPPPATGMMRDSSSVRLI